MKRKLTSQVNGSNTVGKSSSKTQIIIGIFELLSITLTLSLTWWLNTGFTSKVDATNSKTIIDSSKNGNQITNNQINQSNSPNANIQIGTSNKSK